MVDGRGGVAQRLAERGAGALQGAGEGRGGGRVLGVGSNPVQHPDHQMGDHLGLERPAGRGLPGPLVLQMECDDLDELALDRGDVLNLASEQGRGGRDDADAVVDALRYEQATLYLRRPGGASPAGVR